MINYTYFIFIDSLYILKASFHKMKKQFQHIFSSLAIFMLNDIYYYIGYDGPVEIVYSRAEKWPTTRSESRNFKQQC